MDKYETAVAVFPNHDAAEKAVKTLTAAGFDMKNLSVVGRDIIPKRRLSAFTTSAIESSFGAREALRGGFWGLFFGGLFTRTTGGRICVRRRILAAIAVSAMKMQS